MTIRILFLAANPSHTDRLLLDEEIRAIDSAIIQTSLRDRFELISHWAVRLTELQGLLLRHQPAIVHFSGHGSDESEIILQDEDGEPWIVPAAALSALFAILRPTVRCVVLNACYSERQAEAIAEHVDCVVGMSDAFEDRAAIRFAAAFYGALGSAVTLQQAFDLARNQLDLAGIAASHQPRLFVTSADLRLVEVQSQVEDIGGKMSAVGKEDPWWDELAGDLEGIAGLNLDNVSGDVIVANVGAGAQNVAVGKRINQQIGQVMGSPKAEDAEIIRAALSQLTARLVQTDVDPRRAGRAEVHLEMLEEELTKSSADTIPNAEQIQKSGDWLAENIPEITQALAELFGLPAVGRVLGKAGAAAVQWAQQRWRNE